MNVIETVLSSRRFKQQIEDEEEPELLPTENLTAPEIELPILLHLHGSAETTQAEIVEQLDRQLNFLWIMVSAITAAHYFTGLLRPGFLLSGLAISLLSLTMYQSVTALVRTSNALRRRQARIIAALNDRYPAMQLSEVILDKDQARDSFTTRRRLLPYSIFSGMLYMYGGMLVGIFMIGLDQAERLLNLYAAPLQIGP